MSFYALQSQKEDEEEPAPKAFGDVREVIGCEYLVDMHWIGTQPYVAAGKNRYVNSWRKSRTKLIMSQREHSKPHPHHQDSWPSRLQLRPKGHAIP